MYAAYCEKGKLVYAKEVARQLTVDDLQFFCPKCQQRVYLKCSRRGNYYFAHRYACQVQPIHRTYAETEKHKQAKALLQSACKACALEVECEYYVPVIQQTADIYIPQKQLVIEFQHSPINHAELQSRTRHYLQLGLKVIWLMDADCFRQQYGIGWHQTMLQMNAHHELYWQMLDVSQSTVLEWRQMAIFYRKNYRAHLVEKMSLSEWIMNDFKFQRKSWRQSIKRPMYVHYQRQLNQLRHSSSYQTALHSLYQEGMFLNEVPAWMLCEQWQCLLTKSPGWLVLAWVHTLVRKGLSANQLSERLMQVLEWPALPFVDANICHWVTQAALNLYKERESCTHQQNFVTLRKNLRHKGV